MKKHFKITLIILLCAVILGGGFALTRATGANYSETNAFVDNFYIGATDQKKPFFDSILPEIAKNIKENNIFIICNCLVYATLLVRLRGEAVAHIGLNERPEPGAAAH